MARRNGSVLEVLAKCPWWISVILAVVVYVSFIYLIPYLVFQNIFFNAFTKLAPSLAPVFTFMLLFAAALSAFNAWRKGQLFNRQKGIETIRNLSWDKFEELVGEAYRRKGYNVTETGGGGADGGVDLVLRKWGEILLVQCKHWKLYKVGVKIVRELYGVVAAEGASGGIVISSGTFTQEAMDFAKGKPLELLDGNTLQNIITEVQKGETLPRNKLNENVCPKCGAKLVLRTAKKGQNAGEKFWGCSAFPKCKATKPYSG
ncbi:MAG: restriction endonuclease [Smithella sp.]